MASVSVLKNDDVLVFFEKLYEAQQQKARKRAKARLALRSLFLSDKIKQLFFVYVHDAQLKAQKLFCTFQMAVNRLWPPLIYSAAPS